MPGGNNELVLNCGLRFRAEGIGDVRKQIARQMSSIKKYGESAKVSTGVHNATLKNLGVTQDQLDVAMQGKTTADRKLATSFTKIFAAEEAAESKIVLEQLKILHDQMKVGLQETAKEHEAIVDTWFEEQKAQRDESLFRSKESLKVDDAKHLIDYREKARERLNDQMSDNLSKHIEERKLAQEEVEEDRYLHKKDIDYARFHYNQVLNDERQLDRMERQAQMQRDRIEMAAIRQANAERNIMLRQQGKQYTLGENIANGFKAFNLGILFGGPFGDVINALTNTMSGASHILGAVAKTTGSVISGAVKYDSALARSEFKEQLGVNDKNESILQFRYLTDRNFFRVDKGKAIEPIIAAGRKPDKFLLSILDKAKPKYSEPGMFHSNKLSLNQEDYLAGKQYAKMGGTEDTLQFMRDLTGHGDEPISEASKAGIKGVHPFKDLFKSEDFANFKDMFKKGFKKAIAAALIAVAVAPFKVMKDVGKKIVGFFVSAAKSAETIKAIVDMISLPFKIIYTLMAVPLLTAFIPVFKKMISWITDNQEIIQKIGDLFADMFTNVFTEETIDVVTGLMNKFAEVMAFLGRAISENMQTINTDSIAGFIASTITAIAGVIETVMLGLIEFIYSPEGQAFVLATAEAVGRIIGDIIDLIIAMLPVIVEVFVMVIVGIVEGIVGMAIKAVASLLDSVDNMTGGLLSGFVNGIIDIINWIINKVNIIAGVFGQHIDELEHMTTFSAAAASITNSNVSSTLFSVNNYNNITSTDALQSILRTGGY